MVNNYYSNPNKYRHKLYRNIRRSLAHIKWMMYVKKAYPTAKRYILNPVSLGIMLRLKYEPTSEYSLSTDNNLLGKSINHLESLNLLKLKSSNTHFSMLGGYETDHIKATDLGEIFINNYVRGNPKPKEVKPVSNQDKALVQQAIQGRKEKIHTGLSSLMSRYTHMEMEIMNRFSSEGRPPATAYRLIQLQQEQHYRLIALHKVYNMGFVNQFLKNINQHTSSKLSEPFLRELMKQSVIYTKRMNNQWFHSPRAITKWDILQILTKHQIWRSFKRDRYGYGYQLLDHELFKPIQY